MNIKALREAAGLTQQQLADKIGVTRSMVSLYEINESKPSVPVLVKLAKVLGVNLNSMKESAEDRLFDSTRAAEPGAPYDKPLRERIKRLRQRLERKQQQVAALQQELWALLEQGLP